MRRLNSSAPGRAQLTAPGHSSHLAADVAAAGLHRTDAADSTETAGAAGLSPDALL